MSPRLAPLVLAAAGLLGAGQVAAWQSPPVPEDLGGLLAAGEAAIARRQYPEAVALLERAVVLAPGSAHAHAELGRALSLARSFEKAADHLSRAVELGARDLRTRLYLAAAFWEAGRPSEAEVAYREAVETSAGAPLAVHQLGRLLAWQGRFTEAVPLLAEAAGARPGDLDLRLDLASTLAGAGRLAEAEAAFRRLVEQEPGLAKARYGLARSLAGQGKEDEARREMARFGELTREEERRLRSEGREQARLDRAWELLRQGRATEALERFHSLPESLQSLTGRALAQSALGDHQAAVANLERAVTLAPDRQDLRQMLAEERLAVEQR